MFTELLRTRAEIRKNITEKRIDTLIPSFMKEAGVDMWIVAAGDFNEEPVMSCMLDCDPITSTTVVFSLKDGKFEKYWNSRFSPYKTGEFYINFVKPRQDSFEALGELIEELQPKVVALNTSKEFPILDGITHTMYEKITKLVGDAKVVSAELIGMRFMETRLPEEMENYEKASLLARALMREVMSRDVVKPGITTTADIRWYMLDWMSEHNVVPNWMPNVVYQRKGFSSPMIGNEEPEVINEGDLLHIDFGINYLQMQTDMQYLAYVLKEDEIDAPKGIDNGFKTCQRFQEIYMSTVRPGFTGNQVMHEMLDKAKEEKIEAMVYSHPIGFHVHGVGASMGRFGSDGDIPHGEYTLSNNTCYAMEMNVQVEIPEWDNQKIFIFKEENIAIIDGKVKVIGKLQPHLWTI